MLEARALRLLRVGNRVPHAPESVGLRLVLRNDSVFYNLLPQRGHSRLFEHGRISADNDFCQHIPLVLTGNWHGDIRNVPLGIADAAIGHELECLN